MHGSPKWQSINSTSLSKSVQYKPQAETSYSCYVPERVEVIFTGWIQMKPKHEHMIRKKADDKH